MKPDSDDYRMAEARSDTARTEFLSALFALKSRFQPDRLKSDAKLKIYEAMEATKASARASIKSHPGTVAGIVALLIIMIFRRPLLAMARNLYRTGSRAWGTYRTRRNDNAE